MNNQYEYYYSEDDNGLFSIAYSKMKFIESEYFGKDSKYTYATYIDITTDGSYGILKTNSIWCPYVENFRGYRKANNIEITWLKYCIKLNRINKLKRILK